jgi:hypothetical protein
MKCKLSRDNLTIFVKMGGIGAFRHPGSSGQFRNLSHSEVVDREVVYDSNAGSGPEAAGSFSISDDDIRDTRQFSIISAKYNGWETYLNAKPRDETIENDR